MTEPLRCPSHIEQVCVYVRGAVVTRRVELPPELPPGPCVLVVGEISPAALPSTLRAELSGGREVVAVRSRQVVPAVRGEDPALRARLTEVERALADLKARQDLLASQRSRLVGARPAAALTSGQRYFDPLARTRDVVAAGALLEELTAAMDAELAGLAAQRRALERQREQARVAAAQGGAQAAAPHPTLEVSIELDAASATAGGLRISYTVEAARWWPAYTVRLGAGARAGTLGLDAFVAQATLEDWTEVELSVCSTDRVHDVRLPELASLRIGRAQPPRALGFRPPPQGLEGLFAGFDRDRARLGDGAPERDDDHEQEEQLPQPYRAQRPPARPEPAKKRRLRAQEQRTREVAEPEGDLDLAFEDEGGDDLARVGAAPAPQMMMAASAAAPMRARAAAPPPASGGAPPAPKPAPAPAPAEVDPDEWLDFDQLRLAGPSDPTQRGRLLRHREAPPAEVARARAGLDALSAPSQAPDPLHVRPLFDFRLTSAGRLTVPASATPQRCGLVTVPIQPTPSLRTVPREGPEVYREVSWHHPGPTPLLPGPADVYLEGALLTTSPLPPAAPGGELRLGLGVEERVRVARNVRVEEGTRWLGNTLDVDHHITVELRSALGFPTTVEVLDRAPVTDDKAVEISPLPSDPAPQPYTQDERGRPIRGGQRWSVTLPPGGERTLSWGYRLSFSSRSEIAGGNRRE